MKRIEWIATALALALGITGCVNREAQAQGKRTVDLIKDPTVPVSVQPASTQTLTETLEITGQLATSADTTVGSKIAGRLVSVNVQDGSSVTAGQVIAELDASMQRAQVQQAQAQVTAARAALSQAQTNLKIGPQRSAAAVAVAQAQLRAAKAQLAKARMGARSEEVAQAQAQVNAAKSALETAKRDRDRARTLHEQGAISQQRLDAAENVYQSALSNYEAALEGLRMRQNWTRPEDLSSAEEQVRQAEEGLRSAQAQKALDALLDQQVEQARANLRSAEAGLSLAHQNLADAHIRAPFAGKVFGRPAQAGTVLNPGSPAARIVGKEGLYFEGDLPEASVAQVKPGDSVEVTLNALNSGPITGHIVSISPTSQEVARVFRVRVALDRAPKGAMSGMFAHGKVTVRRVAEATVVPFVAIQSADKDPYVFTIEGTKAKKVAVKLGLKTDGLVQVEGITPGAKVVIEGARGLVEGKEVKVQEPAKSDEDSAQATQGA